MTARALVLDRAAKARAGKRRVEPRNVALARAMWEEGRVQRDIMRVIGMRAQATFYRYRKAHGWPERVQPGRPAKPREPEPTYLRRCPCLALTRHDPCHVCHAPWDRTTR